MRLVLLLLPMCTLAACITSTPVSDAPDGDGSGDEDAWRVSLPTLNGDCLNYVDGTLACEVHPVDWPSRRLFPRNGSGRDRLSAGFATQNVAFSWSLDLPAYAVGKTLSFDDPDVRIAIKTLNTRYFSRESAPDGQKRGQIVIHAFDPAARKIKIEFRGVRFPEGHDASCSVQARCAVDGMLEIDGFAETPLGARCGTDHDCGGGYSNRVCDNDRFVCVKGCHQNEDCPIGLGCDASTGGCVEHPGAFPDEVERCTKVCHDLAFHRCVPSEGVCAARCAGAPRQEVMTFLGCTELDRLDCKKMSACFGDF